MSNGIVLSIPQNLQVHAFVLEEALQEALLKSGFEQPQDVRVINPESKNVTLQGVEILLLYIGSSALIWFTNKWLDEYVWPIIKSNIDKDSKRLLNWLRRELELNSEAKKDKEKG